ncbi:gamma-butyrobetaine hydroxylase-like domain-containing protein [Chloroflexota bacterium]
MDTLKPVGITADRQKRIMTVNWNDGHMSEIPFTLLRKACPCAECRGGHENMGGDPEPELFLIAEEDTPATRLVNVEAVGTYGITPVWEDGHHYGIYSWNFLRKLCPCPDCREEAV